MHQAHGFLLIGYQLEKVSKQKKKQEGKKDETRER
jgi:hypothetical protein